MTDTLRELIEMASEHVEGTFDPAKVMMMRHLCVAPDGGLSIYVCPVMSVEEEFMFREMLPKGFPEKYARWVFVTEAWAAEGMKPGDPVPAKHPNRMEIIAFAATDRTGATMTAHRQIYRPAIGGARLMPLVYVTRETLFVMDPQG